MPYKNLQYFLDYYKSDESLIKIKNKLAHSDHQETINLYSNAIYAIEHLIFKKTLSDTTLKKYQSLFIEYETLIKNSAEKDNRHKFIISIPIADRPQHLQSCLQSILTLCEKFQYGGLSNGAYKKISVLIADDSKHIDNTNQHKKIAEQFTKKGLNVYHFGQIEQKSIASILNAEKIKPILGNIETDDFFHKGASITRNITYLKLQKIDNKEEPVLFYFIDSDQEFNVIEENSNHYSINYFYYLDKIFSEKNISMLTGKVVGDPPVSPAVMASTFLDDLLYFITKISKSNPTSPCEFHTHKSQNTNDTAYHDMAELFGQKNTTDNFDYHCTLKGAHNNKQCLTDFTHKLKHFFDGEHPTRKTFYQYKNALDSIQPARTIYTGNYIFKPKNLKYFIPFANLKLRMAGPVLGRILKAELGNAFVSANLPMLHKRTVDTLGKSEFRAGVIHKQNNIDLTDEFIRQFFGDVMLFSTIKLTESGYPKTNISSKKISIIIYETIKEMKKKYTLKHEEIIQKNTILKEHLNNKKNCWHKSADSSQEKLELINFMNNISFNFDNNSGFHKTINSSEKIKKHHQFILDALTNYADDRLHWRDALSKMESRQ